MITGWLILFDMLMLIWMLRRPIDWIKFALIVIVIASIPVVLHLAYRVWSAFTLVYWIDRNAITVRWASSHQVIPLAHVKRIIEGGVAELDAPGVLFWPAPYIGSTGRALGLLNVLMLGTCSMADSVILETDDLYYALTPADVDSFVAAVQVHHELGPTAVVKPEAVRKSAWNRTFGADMLGTLLFGAGLGGALLLFGLLMLGYQNLPDALAFHYNVGGQPDLVRSKEALFLLPIIGLFAWIVNGGWGLWMMWRNDRFGALVLWGGTGIVQLFSLMALLSLMY